MSGFEPYLEGLRARERQTQIADAQAALWARSVALRLAEILMSRYGATNVYLTGSLARGQFEIGSDIDLTVRGLSPDVAWECGESDPFEDGHLAWLAASSDNQPFFCSIRADTMHKFVMTI